MFDSGLPAIYSSCQTQLLIDKGIIKLIQRKFDTLPSEHLKHEYNVASEQHLCDFSSHYSEKKVEDSRKIIDRILDGKRKKAAKSGGNPNEITETIVIDEIRRRCQFDSGNILVQVPTEEPFDVGEKYIKLKMYMCEQAFISEN